MNDGVTCGSARILYDIRRICGIHGICDTHLTIQSNLDVVMVGGATRCSLSRDVRNTTCATFPDHK